MGRGGCLSNFGEQNGNQEVALQMLCAVPPRTQGGGACVGGWGGGSSGGCGVLVICQAQCPFAEVTVFAAFPKA